MGNSVNTFPVPRDDASGLPIWAVAIIASSVGVTLLWMIAIVLLVTFQVCSGRHQSTRNNGRPTPAVSRDSLSSLPPPVPPPARRSSSRSHTASPLNYSQSSASAASAGVTAAGHDDVVRIRKQANLVLENPGFHSSTAGLTAADQHEEGEKEYKLHILDPAEDCSSLASSSNRSSIVSDTGLMTEGTVLSKSVRQRSLKKTDLSTSASVSADDGQTSLEPGRASKNALSGIVLSRPVTIRQLGATIREPGYIASEFRKLPNPSVTNDDIPPGAERKNRYSNVLPSAKTRVHLPVVFGHPNSDYINANYIRGHKGVAHQYIATQGPMDNTIEDFWRMVWENKCEVIVMAVNFQERGIEKSARYWPAQGSEEYGCMEVTLLQQTAHTDYNTSVLQVRLVGSEEARTVRHYRLTCWPVQGVPQSTKPILDFLREIKMADRSGPAIVHCSAGVGRTGTLVALDVGIQSLLQGDTKVDILRIVSTLRQDRPGMVQTKEQYRFIHQALYELARDVGPK